MESGKNISILENISFNYIKLLLKYITRKDKIKVSKTRKLTKINPEVYVVVKISWETFICINYLSKEQRMKITVI